MRLVLISDTHGLVPVEAIPEGDILIHAGDLSMSGSSREIYEAGKWLQKLPHKHKIVIAGNHDFFCEEDPHFARLRLEGGGVKYLFEESAVIEGLFMFGSPYTPWFHNWAFNVRGYEAMKARRKLLPKELDILITHGPPYGTLDQINPLMNTGCLGDVALMEELQTRRVGLHVFGHIHGGYGMFKRQKTTFYNASLLDEAYQVVNKPFIVDL